MSSRDADFPLSIREALAKRTGCRCSFPGCNCPTIGPSDESAKNTSNTGMACHIAAASDGPGARRVDPDMTTEQLSDIDNGIWMCYKHGKLIDTDEIRFTAEMLRKWREIAELRAKISQDLGNQVDFDLRHFSDINLATKEISLDSYYDNNQVIGNTFRDCCVHELWGNEFGNVLRDLVIELLRNSFQHGGATTFTLNIEPLRLCLTDDGAEFDPWSLYHQDKKRGGSTVVKHIIQEYGDKIIFGTKRIKGLNKTIIALARSINDIPNITPCTISVDTRGNITPKRKIHVMMSCNIIHVILPSFTCTSDIYLISRMVAGEIPKDKQIVFIVNDMSQYLTEILKEEVPGCRVVRVLEQNDIYHI